MKQIPQRLLVLLSLILSACSAVVVATPGNSESTQISSSPSDSPAPDLTSSTDITPTSELCAYMWATHELRSLSQKVNSSFQALDPNLTGSAYAYGEDCVYADGHSTFSAMETDFRAKVSVTDLTDEKALGDWISSVMGIILKLPSSDLSGPQPGRVDFEFTAGPSQVLNLKVTIAKYQSGAASLTGVELFRFFKNNP